MVVRLDFLEVSGQRWDQATVGDVEAFKHWRLTDLSNRDRVQPASFDTDPAAINALYAWAGPQFGVVNPVPAVRTSTGRRGMPPGAESGEVLQAGRDGLRAAGARRRQVTAEPAGLSSSACGGAEPFTYAAGHIGTARAEHPDLRSESPVKRRSASAGRSVRRVDDVVSGCRAFMLVAQQLADLRQRRPGPPTGRERRCAAAGARWPTRKLDITRNSHNQLRVGCDDILHFYSHC